jgi:hypothetical protein
MKLHLGVYRETVWHFESKERPGEVCVCCVKEYTARSFSLIKMFVVSADAFSRVMNSSSPILTSSPCWIVVRRQSAFGFDSGNLSSIIYV